MKLIIIAAAIASAIRSRAYARWYRYFFGPLDQY
jgi:hypothetical protein